MEATENLQVVCVSAYQVLACSRMICLPSQSKACTMDCCEEYSTVAQPPNSRGMPKKQAFSHC